MVTDSISFLVVSVASAATRLVTMDLNIVHSPFQFFVALRLDSNEWDPGAGQGAVYPELAPDELMDQQPGGDGNQALLQPLPFELPRVDPVACQSGREAPAHMGPPPDPAVVHGMNGQGRESTHPGQGQRESGFAPVLCSHGAGAVAGHGSCSHPILLCLTFQSIGHAGRLFLVVAPRSSALSQHRELPGE